MNAILTDLSAWNTTGEWAFVRPAAEFGAHAPGEKLGHYRTSGEVALFDAKSKSAISSADIAAAIIDEIETPTVKQAQLHFAY